MTYKRGDLIMKVSPNGIYKMTEQVAMAMRNNRVQRIEDLKEKYLGKSSDFIKQVNQEFLELLQASIITNSSLYGTHEVHIDEVVCNLEIAFDLVMDRLKGGDNIECTDTSRI